MCDGSPSCPAAAKPPVINSTHRDPVKITIKWTKPTIGATPTGYIIYYQADDDQGNMRVESNATMAVISVKPTKKVYTISMVTLSDMLPSTRSLSIKNCET